MSNTSPLSCIRVLDLTHYVAGPYCTKLFADLGADVIKIEKPERGDGARWLPPFIEAEPHPEKSALFLYLNTNKRSVTLDLKTPEGKKRFKDLVLEADIVVENFRPGVMSRLGFDYRALERLNPRLILTSISNFGQDGPYRDWQGTELTLSALTGMMYMTGSEEREPLKLALSQVQYTAGAAAAVATLAAYRYSRLYGSGQHVDVSIIEPMLNTIHQQTARYSHWGRLQLRESHAGFPHFVKTRDGWLHISPLWIDDLKDFVDIPELKDPKFDNLVTIRAHMEEFRATIEPWFKDKNTLEIFHDAQERGISWAPVHDEADLLSCPQLEARDYFIEIEHPVVGRGKYPGRYFVSEQIKKQDQKPAPQLGRHTDEVLGHLGSSHTGRSGIVSSGTPEKPLSGIRILSTEHWAALPHATKYLASMGAEVITIESPVHPYHDPRVKTTTEGGGLYHEGARNKLAISLDLSKPEGVEIFKRLVKVSDVVTDNFSPRVMKNFGLEYDTLRQVKSDIIVLSLSGYGHKGPWYLYRGYAVTTEAASGLVNLTGYADGPPERPGGTPFGDVIPAIHAAWSILAALEYRTRTGEGAFIDIGMLEPCIGQLGEAILHFSITGQPLNRTGNRDPNAAPSGCYRCKGEDKWVTIAACNEKQWKSLVSLLGTPLWASDERFQTKESRLMHPEALDKHIEQWTRELDHVEIMKRCQDAGVPAGAVLNVGEVMRNEHYIARGSFEVVQHPAPPEGIGNRLHIGVPWKLSKTPASSVKPGAYHIGKDNDYVYRELLGLSDEEIFELDKKEVICKKLIEEPRTILIPPEFFGELEEDFLQILGMR